MNPVPVDHAAASEGRVGGELARTLAQTTAQDLPELLFWLGVVVALIIVGVVAATMVRKRLSDKAMAPPSLGLFEQLREMRRTGAISEEEYERIRGSMVRAADRPASAASPGLSPRAGGDVPPPAPRVPDERRARPGYDLLGNPLPRPIEPTPEPPPGTRDLTPGDADRR